MLANSSAHGLSNLVSDKSILVKMIWAVSILLSISGCLLFISSSLIEYFHYDVITNVRIRHEYSLDYPAVTFCAYNANFSSVREDLSLSIIRQCRFSAMKCDMSYFNEIQILQAGQRQACLQFNGRTVHSDKESLKVSKAGFTHSLAIDFDIRPDLLLYFSVENNNQIPFYRNFRYQIKAGKTYYKSVDKVVRKTLGKPFNECVEGVDLNNIEFDSRFVNETILREGSYRRDNCLEICFHENYRKVCNCTLSDGNESNSENDCIRYSGCYVYFLESFNINESCDSFCPLECNSVLFEIKHDSDVDIKNPLLLFDKNDGLRNDLKILDTERQLYLYFQELTYTEFVQIPKTTVTNLVSNIGGTLGLFLGLSLLSFIEFIELITNLSF